MDCDRVRLANIHAPSVVVLPFLGVVLITTTAVFASEEKRLLEECSKSRSRSLNPAVTLALSTAMRYSEIRLLKWKQVDFSGKQVWVGKSKTEYGEGRPIPMNDRAFLVMSMWAETFPNHTPEHYVFPTEKYGAAGDDFKPCTYATDPTVPIGDWKEAWEAAKKRAGVSCRFHDLQPHSLHADARIRHATFSRGNDHGLESVHYREDVAALRAYRAGRTARGSKASQWGRFWGRCAPKW